MKWSRVAQPMPMPVSWRLTVGLAMAVTLLVTGSVHAAVLDVYPGGSIQAAIGGAGTGDTVIVHQGTYVERINFLGKAITVTSEDPTNPTVVANTVIDGGAGGTVVRFASGEGNSSVLTGLTITNGHATYGGGIYCSSNSSPTIEGNSITGNHGNDDGGGIYCISNSSPTIEGNSITGNQTGNYSAAGGGIYCYDSCSPTIQGNTITGNQTATDRGSGGGIYCGLNSSPTIQGNTISGNYAGTYGGGGIHLCYSSSPTIEGNTINGNTAEVSGGGIYWHSNCSPIIQSNTICGNQAGTHGGGICYYNACSPTIQGNTISGNTAEACGGGIYFCPGTSPNVCNNIISGNTAGSGGGMYVDYVGSESPAVSYCDVCGNTGGNYVGMPDHTGSDGNISVDPLFAGGSDYHLRSRGGRWNGTAWVTDTVHSPCIDAGNPASSYTNEPAPNGGRVNMGAYGGTVEASKSWEDLRPVTVFTSPADGTTVHDASVLIHGTAADDVGLVKVITRVNGGAWSIATGTTNWSAWATINPGGANLIEARAYDSAGHWGPIVGITLQGTADLRPVTMFGSPAEGAAVGDSLVLMTGTAADDVSLVKVIMRVNGGPWSVIDGTTNWSGWVRISPGANLIEARAYDSAGKWGPIVARTLNGVSNPAPVARFTAPLEGATIYDSLALVSGTAVDDSGIDKVVVRVNGGSWFVANGGASWSALVPMASGPNLVEARGYDIGGRWGPIVGRTLIGAPNLRPVASVTAPADGSGTSDAQVAVTGTADDDGTVVKVIVRVNGGPWAIATGTTSWNRLVNLAPGANLIEARAYDDVGLWGPIAGITINRSGVVPAALTALVLATPTSAGAEVCVTLSAGAAVTVEVLNIAGRPVRVIVRDREMAAGTTTVAWNGRSQNGLAVPSGTYLVRITARGGDGASFTALQPLMVTR